MVSWDIKVKFYGLSPNIRELEKLAKEQKFSNIESITGEIDGTYILVVNDRGLNQTEFKFEVIN